MKYYICRGCEGQFPCFSAVPDDPMPPKTCLTSKFSQEKWERVSSETFLDEISSLDKD